LETDAPYLTPVPYRGVPNAPFYLPFIAQTIADLKEVSVDELLAITYKNSLDCLFVNAQ
jgi:TatD DNase family protein